jgi:hypothetical protein
MRQVAWAAACLIVVATGGCGATKPRDLILGKWKAEPLIIEFKPDGSFVGSLVLPDGKTSPGQTGRYSFTSDDIMEMTTSAKAEGVPAKVDKAKVDVTPETLTMTYEVKNTFQVIGPTAKNDNLQQSPVVIKFQRVKN